MVDILDSTLREGEQTPGVTFSVQEKLIIAGLLDELGVTIIEAGHPAVSDDIFRAVKEIARQGYTAETMAHCRAIREDIDRARACDVDWVGIFLCVSNPRLKQQFQSNLPQAIESIADVIMYAKTHGLNVRYTPEDTVRTAYPSVVQVARAAVEAGADRISIADTVGAMTPRRMYDFVLRLQADVNVKLNVHCHNDLGLATANALAAYEAGATTIDVSVNGLGERTGITSLAEACLGLHCLYKAPNNWNLEVLPRLSQTVSEYSGMPISPATPVVGKNAFIHNAGMHVAAILHDPRHYEVFPAEVVGRTRNVVLDKMAGAQTIKHKLKQLGYPLCEPTVTQIMHHVKSKEKGMVSDTELIAFINNVCYEKAPLLLK